MTESFILRQGSQMGTPAKSIAEQVLESGAEVFMFVNSAKNLIVLDAITGETVSATGSLQHHDAAIRINELGEPVLFDTKTGKDMVRHEETAGGFRDSTPISTRIHDARIIYFWQYTGSLCICTWSGGNHYVRCRRSGSTSHHLEPFVEFSGGKGIMSVAKPGEATAEQVLESGAEVVMFVNSAKNLIVLDAKTGETVSATSSLQHGGHHDAAIRINELGEPVLFDTKTGKAMVRHEKTAGGFRDSTPISTRIHDARIIYFWQYTGSHCICMWSGGNHYVRCRRSRSTSHHLEPFVEFSGGKGIMSEGKPEEATIVRDKDSKTVDSGIWESLTRANDGSVSPPEATDTKSTPPPKPVRFLNARANPQVTLNEEFPLTVQIAGEALTAGEGCGTTGIDGSISGRLLIDVYAPAFKMLDGSTKPLDVPETGRSVPIRFPLQALKPGIQSIEISAWQNSAYVATVTVYVAVDAVPVSDGNVLGDVDLRKPEEHEWSLNITYDSNQKRYSFDFVGPDGFRLDVTGDRLQGHSLNVYNGLLKDLNAQARNLYARQPQEVTAWLQGMGGDMFRTLIPQVIKDAIWERSDRIRRLNIFTRNDPLPWEVLFVTSHRESEGRFLVDSATVCRWTYGRTWPSSLRKGTPSYVILGGAPPSAQAEIAVVQALVGSGNTIDDPMKLTALLRSGGFGLMHFAAHNIQPTTPVGGPYIPFAGGQRFDLTYMGSIPDDKYVDASPFIFMNACTSVGVRPIYTELNGWATRFLQCGAGAYVGALWEIRDTSATKFSEAFYGELTSGKNLGQAMAAGRGAISSGDPTRLAYTPYGNPLAKIE